MPRHSIVAVLLACVLSAWAARPAAADGKVFAPRAEPRIPAQSALLHYADGVETLAIETRFEGEGADFAWVVPFPSPPEVSQATAGLFPTLRAITAPRLESPSIVPAFLFVLLTIAWLCGIVGGWRGILGCVLCFVALGFLLLPMTAKPRGAGSSVGEGVRVLDRRLVGAFDVATITGESGGTLGEWLTANGFHIPPAATPVIDAYAAEGWCFVAAKLRVEGADERPLAPHPLVFRFAADRPIYPLRLTGVGGDPLAVDLYVFGPDRAAAPGFEAERCTRPAYPDPEEFARYHASGPVRISHPTLRALAHGAPVLTKLTAELTPGQMLEDAVITWEPFQELGERALRRDQAPVVGVNVGAGALFVGVAVAAFVARRRGLELRRGVAWLAGPLLAGAVVGVGAALVTPLVVRTGVAASAAVTVWHADAGSALERHFVEHPDHEDRLAAARAFVRAYWEEHAEGRMAPIEEDSPGNYTFRERDGRLEYVAYDAYAAERAHPVAY